MEVILYILFLLAITIFCLGIIGIVVFVLIRESKKVAAENAAKEKAIREEEADFQNSKNEFLAGIEKWEKNGVPVIAVKDKVINQYNDVYFIGENFYLKSLKSNNLTKGTLMFVNKEICFLSDTLVRDIPHSQILKVDLGPFEIKFTSKKYQTPLSFLCITDNHYKDRLEVCEAYARWYLINGFSSKDFLPDLVAVLNMPKPNFQKVVINKTE